MNKSYMYTKDNIVVFDEKNRVREFALRDNIEELLLTENLISMIDIVLDNESYEIDKIDNENLQQILIKNLVEVPSFILIPYILDYINGNHINNMIDTIFGQLPENFIEGLFCGAIGLLFLNLLNHKYVLKSNNQYKCHGKIYETLKLYSWQQQIKYSILELQDQYSFKSEINKKVELNIEKQQQDLQYIVNSITYYNKYIKKFLKLYEDNLIDKLDNLHLEERQIIKKLIKNDIKGE